MTGDHSVVLIPVIFFTAALLVPLCRRGSRRWPYWVALVSSLLGVAASGEALWRTLSTGEAIHYHLAGWRPPMGIELIADPLSAFFCLLITVVTVFVLWHGRSLVESETPGKAVPFYSCVMLLLGGLSGILLTGDLFNLYVFLEISSIAGYALVAIGDKRAPVASFRYLILGTIGASLYLLGVGFLFMTVGSLNMGDIASVLQTRAMSPVEISALLLIVLGIGVKMALFPLHGWLVDAYTHASSTATSLIAPIGTKVAAYVLIRALFYLFDTDLVREGIPVMNALAVMGAVGMLWGGVLAMAQTDLKRMLAFSSVGHVGYIALGIGLASPLGFIAAVLHTLNHSVMKAVLFLICGSLRQKLGDNALDSMNKSLRLRMPWTMAAFTLAAISMIGLPPTAGFFSKWYLVLGSLEQGKWHWVIVIVLSSLFSVVYFFRVLERVYLRPQEGAEEEPAPARDESRPSMLAPVLILSASLLLLGLGNVMIVNHLIRPMLPAGF